jgi:hypothetical protein
MANKNFIVKNGLEVGGQEVVSSSGVVTSAALGGQTLASTDSPTFNNLTLTNDIAVGGDLNLTGDLNITGDVNSLSVTDLDVTDQTITLGAGQVESASGGSGIVVDGSGASILWDETNTEFDINNSINVTGTITSSGNITGTLATAAQPNITSVGTLTGFTSTGIDDNATSTAITIDSSENVQIGSNSFTAPRLQLYAAGTGESQIFFGNDGTNGFKDGAIRYFHESHATTADRRNMTFSTGTTERMRINATGVGIGTTSPENNLHIFTNSGDEGLTIKATGDTSNAIISDANRSGAGAAINQLVGKWNGTAVTDIRFTTGSDTTNKDNGQIKFYTATAGTTLERMVIDDEGNVGIGETSPAKLGLIGSSTGKVLALGGDDCQLRLTYTVLHHDHSGNTTTHLRNHYGSLDSLARMKLESGYISFHTGTAFTEAMRISSSGNLLMGNSYDAFNAKANIYATGSGASTITLNLWNGGGSGCIYERFVNSGGAAIGSITQNGASAVAYNTTSDARLKDVTGSARGLEVINELNPVAYNWKEDGKADEGLIAQEVLNIVPNSVSGSEEDMYQMDYSKLVVHLVAGMKEQQTIIDDLKARLDEAGL